MPEQRIGQRDQVRMIGQSGPIMAVANIEDGTRVECHWFGRDGEPRMAIFPLSVLEWVDPDAT